MSDPEAVRKDWARRVTDEYDGWPYWAAPDAPAGRRPDGPGAQAGQEQAAPADVPDAAGSRTASGWAWGVPDEELADVDLRLALRRRTGDTARALREERAYWGLNRPTGD